MNPRSRVRTLARGLLLASLVMASGLRVSPVHAADDDPQPDWAEVCGAATDGPISVGVDASRPVSWTAVFEGPNVSFGTTQPAGCAMVRDQGPGTSVKSATTSMFAVVDRGEWLLVCGRQFPQQDEDLNIVIESGGWDAQVDNVAVEFFGDGDDLILHFQRSSRVQGFAVLEHVPGSPACTQTGSKWAGQIVLVDPQVPGLDEPAIPTVTDLVNLVRGDSQA